MTDRFVDADGVRLAVRDYGGEGQPLVFVHGGPGPNLALWDAFARRMAPVFRCVAYDQRGHGRSVDADDYAYAALAADIRAIVEEIGLAGPVVVGHSWGALVALVYAATYPGRCAGVIGVDGLITGGPLRAMSAGDWAWLEDQLRANPVYRRTLGWIGTPADLAEFVAWLREALPAHAPGYSAEIFLRDVVAGPGGLLRHRHTAGSLLALNRAAAAAAAPPVATYGRIRCPALLVMGTRGMFPAAEVERVRARYPRLRVAWVEGGHVLQEERPEELAALVADFVASLPDRDRRHRAGA